MPGNVVLAAFGYVNKRGFGGNRRRHAWPTPSCEPPAALQWRDIADKPFDRFGRLGPLCQYAVIAVEMLDLDPPAQGRTRADTAVILGTTHGSAAVDAKFYHTVVHEQAPSPILFAYTLPSTAVAEIAIRHRITGPNLCCMAVPESGLLALWEGVRLIEAREARRCVCVAADVTPALGGLREQASAFAFLLGAPPSAAAPDRPPLAEVRIERGAAPEPRESSPNAAPLDRIARFLTQRKGDPSSLCVSAPAALKTSETITFTK